jgi:serine/threonine protein phosphatase PrpC
MAKKTPASITGFTSYALSDQGVRGNNEDLVHHDDERGIYFVVDGMGGHAAGEQAARIAGERLRGRLERATGSPQQRIREAIALANNAIFDDAARNPDWAGMACVLTVAIVANGAATIGHVGDSRLYKLRGPDIEKITRDHSPVGELEDSNQLNEISAMSHPRRNEVFRDVGSARRDPDDPDFIDIYEITVEPDSALLLCSDGLTDAVPQSHIVRIVRDNVRRPDKTVEALVDRAKKMEAKDNISVVLVQGPAFGSKPSKASHIETPAAAQSPTIQTIVKVVEKPFPIGQKIAWLAAGMVLGAALLFGVLRILQPPQKPVPPTATSQPAPPIRVDPRKPGSHPTIAAALGAAAEGDTIELAPGLYQEPVRIEKSNVIINGSGAVLGGDGLTIARAAGVQIRNLRIGGSVRLNDSQVSLRNVHIVGASGAGIEAGGTSTVNMDSASVRDCTGAGVVLRGASTANIKYSLISGNGRDPRNKQPGILNESTGTVTLSGNTIADNGGPAIAQSDIPQQDLLDQNLFSLDGRKGRLEDVRIVRRPSGETAEKKAPKK